MCLEQHPVPGGGAEAAARGQDHSVCRGRLILRLCKLVQMSNNDYGWNMEHGTNQAVDMSSYLLYMNLYKWVYKSFMTISFCFLSTLFSRLSLLNCCCNSSW